MGKKLNDGHHLLLWSRPHQVQQRPSRTFQQPYLWCWRHPHNSCVTSIPLLPSTIQDLCWSLQSKRCSSTSTPSTLSETDGYSRKLTGFLPTPFIWLQLCLQVLWRDVVFLLFTLRRFRFTLPTATITAAAQTATAIAACDEPTEHKQGLQRTEDKEIFITCAYHATITEFVRLRYRNQRPKIQQCRHRTY